MLLECVSELTKHGSCRRPAPRGARHRARDHGSRLRATRGAQAGATRAASDAVATHLPSLWNPEVPLSNRQARWRWRGDCCPLRRRCPCRESRRSRISEHRVRRRDRHRLPKATSPIAVPRGRHPKNRRRANLASRPPTGRAIPKQSRRIRMIRSGPGRRQASAVGGAGSARHVLGLCVPDALGGRRVRPSVSRMSRQSRRSSVGRAADS